MAPHSDSATAAALAPTGCVPAIVLAQVYLAGLVSGT